MRKEFQIKFQKILHICHYNYKAKSSFAHKFIKLKFIEKWSQTQTYPNMEFLKIHP